MSGPEFHKLPGIALVDDEPVFNEPWEAQAFAMAVALHKEGLFTWTEWADALSTEIHGPTERDYYRHWLCALEKLTSQKQAFSPLELQKREEDWHRAAARTPHGEPIEL